jgi:hypothetical protein
MSRVEVEFCYEVMMAGLAKAKVFWRDEEAQMPRVMLQMRLVIAALMADRATGPVLTGTRLRRKLKLDAWSSQCSSRIGKQTKA